MIKVPEMTEFVNNNVIDQVRRKEKNLVVEIEIPFLRAATPARFMVFDKYFTQRMFVKGVEVGQPCMHEHPRLLLVV